MSDSAARSNADEVWDDLLDQLATQPKAQPRPFFYTRVQARLAAETSGAPRPMPLGWLWRPAYAVLLGALVLMLSGDGAALRPAAGAAPYNASPR